MVGIARLAEARRSSCIRASRSSPGRTRVEPDINALACLLFTGSVMPRPRPSSRQLDSIITSSSTATEASKPSETGALARRR